MSACLKAFSNHSINASGLCFEGDIAEGELEIGQVAALIDKVQTTKEVIDEMIADYKASLSRVNTF